MFQFYPFLPFSFLFFFPRLLMSLDVQDCVQRSLLLSSLPPSLSNGLLSYLFTLFLPPPRMTDEPHLIIVGFYVLSSWRHGHIHQKMCTRISDTRIPENLTLSKIVKSRASFHTPWALKTTVHIIDIKNTFCQHDTFRLFSKESTGTGRSVTAIPKVLDVSEYPLLWCYPSSLPLPRVKLKLILLFLYVNVTGNFGLIGQVFLFKRNTYMSLSVLFLRIPAWVG